MIKIKILYLLILGNIYYSLFIIKKNEEEKSEKNEMYSLLHEDIFVAEDHSFFSSIFCTKKNVILIRK